jgi:hypothetical protein
MKTHDAPQIFKAILSPGAQATIEGKLYALCGIRATDRAEFDKYASIVVENDTEATTMRGCCVGKEKVADLVKQIRDGYYAPFAAP